MALMLASPLFDDVLFPLAISRRSTVGPEFSTEITETDGGFEHRNQNWQGGRLRFDVAPGVRIGADYDTLLAFFRCRAGAARGFRLCDWTDDRSCPWGQAPAPTDQLLATGDGAGQFFELVKTYVSGPVSQGRRITRPVVGSVRVALGGVEQSAGPGATWAVDHDTGIVTFLDPPPAGVAVTAGFRFDVPARFGTDSLAPTWLFEDAHQVPEIPIVEIRE